MSLGVRGPASRNCVRSRENHREEPSKGVKPNHLIFIYRRSAAGLATSAQMQLSSSSCSCSGSASASASAPAFASASAAGASAAQQGARSTESARGGGAACALAFAKWAFGSRLAFGAGLNPFITPQPAGVYRTRNSPALQPATLRTPHDDCSPAGHSALGSGAAQAVRRLAAACRTVPVPVAPPLSANVPQQRVRIVLLAEAAPGKAFAEQRLCHSDISANSPK